MQKKIREVESFSRRASSLIFIAKHQNSKEILLCTVTGYMCVHVRVCVCVGVCESREQSDQINLTPTLPLSVATKHRAQKKK